MTATPFDRPCSVCGGRTYRAQAVLWPDLIEAWELAPEEVAYIDRQQGTCCTACGANLRSIALADALCAALDAPAPLKTALDGGAAAALSILEINEAGTLNPLLSAQPGHVLAAYPAVDMQATPYPGDAFDLIVHSDTLEHVADPIAALRECRRILKPGGSLCYTVPTVVGRLSRSTAGRPKSWHGDPAESGDDFLVHTEFGADAWTYPIRAGFDAVAIHAVDYPAATALRARKAA